jgi:hypothetical protein
MKRGTEVFGENPVPGTHYPTEIPHGIPGIGSGDFGHVQNQNGDALEMTTLHLSESASICSSYNSERPRGQRHWSVVYVCHSSCLAFGVYSAL